MIKRGLILSIFITAGLAFFLLAYNLLGLVMPDLIKFHTIFNLLEIVFYRGIVSAVIAFLLMLELILPFRKNNLVKNTIIISAFISFSINITFLIVFPVTIDRSVTTYLLEELQQKPDLTEEELTEVFINNYVKKRKAIKRRMNEQIASGNVARTENGALSLTHQGQDFMKFSSFIKQIFGLPDREASDEPNS